ncbi:MAG: DUF4360 domain-containing protein [Thiolinea sp.]
MNSMNIIVFIAAVLFGVTASQSAQASQAAVTHTEKAYSFKTPLSMAGTGCTASSVSLDAGLPFVGFAAYQANSKERVGCSLAVAVQVLPGYQIAVDRVRYSGKVSSRGLFKYKVFFAGISGQAFTERQPIPTSGDEYFAVDDIAAPLWSACGRDVNLRFNTSLQTFAESNSISLKGFSFRVIQRAC